MKVVKFQQEILAQAYNNRIKYAFDSDNYVIITIDGTYAYRMPEPDIMVDLAKLGTESDFLCSFVKAYPQNTAIRTSMECRLKNNVVAVLFKSDARTIYINKKFLAYCDKSAEYKCDDTGNIIYAYENGNLIGVFMCIRNPD